MGENIGIFYIKKIYAKLPCRQQTGLTYCFEIDQLSLTFSENSIV